MPMLYSTGLYYPYLNLDQGAVNVPFDGSEQVIKFNSLSWTAEHLMGVGIQCSWQLDEVLLYGRYDGISVVM